MPEPLSNSNRLRNLVLIVHFITKSRSGSRLGEVRWLTEYSTLLEGTQVVRLVSDLNQQEWMNKLHYLIAYCETVQW